MLTEKLLSLGTACLAFLPYVFAQPANPGVCPDDNGKYRTTSSGTYLITCNMRIGSGWMNPKEDVQQDFAACIDSCAAKTGCEAVDYNQNSKSCGYIMTNTVPTLPYAVGLGVHNARKAVKPSQGRPKPPVNPPKPVDPPVDPKPPIVDPVKPDDQQKPIIDPAPSPNPVYSEKAICVADHGKIYITNDGTAYKLQCSYSAPGRAKLGDPTTETSYAACMEKCSSNTRCNSVQFSARPVPGSSSAQGDCIQYGDSLEATIKNEEYDFAVQVDPPTHDEDDFPNQLCTTECPFADGMTYTSSYGESFKMDCGKRHGTKLLTTTKADSFQDCMEMCAALVPCHSVDYQTGKQKCFMGSHHGNPVITASSFQSAHSIGCAGACSGGGGCCGGNSTARKSMASEPSPFPDTSCGNEGFAYGIYPNQDGGKNHVYQAPNDATFNPALFKTMQPYFTGTTNSIGIADTTKPNSIYGKTAKDGGFVTVNHRGYLYAMQGGEYTFTAPGVDDISLLWVGDKAYSGWVRQNANLDQAYISGGSSPKEYKQTLEKGKYYPIRFVFANSGGAGFFKFKISAPDGTVVIDDKTVSCPYVVKFGCKAEYKAPEFSAWGAES